MATSQQEELFADNPELMKTPLWYYIRKNRRSFTLGMFFLLITNVIDGIYPLILKEAVDLVAAQAKNDEIQRISLFFFLVMAGLALTRYLWRNYFGRYHTDAAEDLRNRLFYHITKMGPTYFKKNPVGEILSVMINDVQSFRHAIGQGVLVFVDGIVILTIIVPLMIQLNPTWTWQTLILLPLVPLMIQKITKIIFKSYKDQQDKLAELSGISQELVAGVRVIKSFAQEKSRIENYNRYSKAYEQSCNKTAKWDSLFQPTMEFGVTAGSVILLFVGAQDVLSGAVSIGTFVAFHRYIRKMVWPMTALGLGFSQFQKGMASFERIKDVFRHQTDIPDHGMEQIEKFKSLEVKNLTYQYPDGNSPVLKNLNFEIQAGELVGIVGPVGSGKTTLLHLLTRLYPAEPNSILINGLSLEKISQKSLHEKLVMVPQEAFLFSDTISENIRFGQNEDSALLASEGELDLWAKAVDIDHEIQALPSGYASQLGERGVNLSGGQKQRLTIARALCTRAPVVILDDSLSAVDVSTEANIQQAIRTLSETQKTRIIVAHRLTSVENADRIIVLKDGVIEAMGKHAELLKSSPTYRAMAEIQGHHP